MKKAKFLTTLMLVATLAFGTSSIAADNNNTIEESFFKEHQQAPVKKEFKIYDKNGNELKTPPKPGEAVYDKDGNKLPPPPCMKHMPKGPELNLTDKQKEKADKIREASKVKIKPIRREIHNLKNEIWEIREDDSLTMEQKKEKIEPLMVKVKELRTKADSIRQEDMKQFENLLTKEQKKTLEEFKKTHKPDKKQFKRHHMHPMGF